MNSSDCMTLTAAVTDHVRKHALEYYPELVGRAFEVRAAKVRRRQFADLCELEIRTPAWSRRLLAKIALSPDEIAAAASSEDVRSYFVASSDPPGAEFKALKSLARHLERTGDPRFFAVRVIDSILNDRALLLEMAHAQPLTQCLKSASRLHSSRKMPALLAAVGRTGACLRSFHNMPPSGQRQERGATKDQFLAWVDAAEEFVVGDDYGREFFRRVCPRTSRLAEQILPEQLPTGPLHDDFAPRNVLVDSQGRVAMIDMLEEWSGCVWQDIGHFLMSIGTNKAQAISGGRLFPPHRLEQIRAAFLTGYYVEQRPPLPEILLYECQVTLTKWAAWVQRVAAGSQWRGALKRTQLAVSARWYAQYVEQCLNRAEVASLDATRELTSVSHLLAEGTP